MSLGRWVLGAVTVGVTLGAAGAQAGPLPLVPMGDQHSVQNVQFFFDDPPPVYYDPPPRPYYRDYRPREDYPPPPRAYYAPPPRAYYAPPPRRYGPRRRATATVSNSSSIPRVRSAPGTGLTGSSSREAPRRAA